MDSPAIDPFKASNADIIAWCETASFVVGGECFRGIVQPAANVIIKIGGDVTAQEAANQTYAYEQLKGTKLRVPRVYRFFCEEKDFIPKGYLMMEYVPGKTMSDYLANDHSNDQEIVRSHYAQLIYEASIILSNIPVPEFQRPGPVSGGEPRGYLFSETGFGCMANFESTHDMTNWLNQRLMYARTPHMQKDLAIRKLAIHQCTLNSAFDFQQDKLTTVHGDLAPRNFIIMDDGQLDLLDWAFAGFYPRAFEAFACRVRFSWDPILLKVSELLNGTKEVDDLFWLLRCVQIVNYKVLPVYIDSSLPQPPVVNDFHQSQTPRPALSAERIAKEAIRKEKYKRHLEKHGLSRSLREKIEVVL